MNSTSASIKLLALFGMFILLAPGIVSAENYSTISNEVIVNAPSTHAAQYDQLVNVADETSATNDQSWVPVINGIYFGSSTPESSFQFSDVVTNNSKMMISSVFKFSSAQIMSGASEFRVRTPVQVTPGLFSADLEILRVPTADYVFTWASTDWSISTSAGAVWRTAESYALINSTGGYTSTAAAYIEDDRLYYNVIAPIVPNVYYVFVLHLVYSDGAFTTYLAPSDIIGDALYRTYINRYVAPTVDPSVYTVATTNYTIDAGWSFDMSAGYSAPVTSRTDYYQAGDAIHFYSYVRGFDNVSGYHIINIPFISDLGYVNATVSVEDIAYSDIWSQTEVWYGSIIAASPSATVGSGIGYNFARVTITINEAQHITWIMKDPERVDLNTYTSTDISYNVTSSVIIDHATYNQFVFFSFFSSYIISSTNVSQITPYYVQVIPTESFSFQKALQWAPLVLFVFFSGLGPALVTSAVVAQMFGVSIIPDIGYTSPVEYGLGVVSWLNDNIPKIPGLDPWNAITGFVSNLIDAVWSALVGLGQWLWSVGEWIYDSLVWLANAIVEYGSILLGLLIIGVAMMLFFWPVKVEIQMLNAFLLMAQGKFEQGANLGYATGKKVTDAFSSGSKKIIRRLK